MADAREIGCDPVAVPASLADAVAGYRWARDTIGEAGAAVHRLHAPGRPDLYLKHGRGDVADDVVDEMVRLRWLAGRIAVPATRGFVATPAAAWLLTEALPGRTAYQLFEDGEADHGALVDALAGFLRRLHGIAIDDCPFDAGHHHRLARARARMVAGQVDTDDFGEAHEGWTAEQVWAEMTALLPFTPERVVTHGDYSLDNLLIDGGEVVGCIDVGRLGIADRYQDLAILSNCLGEFGEAAQARMWAAYGIAAPDPPRLRFHLMLDEFF